MPSVVQVSFTKLDLLSMRGSMYIYLEPQSVTHDFCDYRNGLRALGRKYSLQDSFTGSRVSWDFGPRGLQVVGSFRLQIVLGRVLVQGQWSGPGAIMW